MKKTITLIIVALTFFTVNIAYAQQKPSCTSPVGIWINELNSKLKIETFDAATGQITGHYQLSKDPTWYSLVGWINDDNTTSGNGTTTKTNKARVISFTVRFNQYGSITSWTGTCSGDKIVTLWNLARPVSQDTWDHILSGSDTFTPSNN